MKVIAIHGPMGSGKTTLTNLLVEKCKMSGLKVEILPFAKPLKDAARALGWNGLKDTKGRKLLQLLGTECGRNCIDQDIWVKKWYKAIYDAELDTDVVICDDLRFPNEYNILKTFNIGIKCSSIKIKGRGSNINTWYKKIINSIKNILGLLHASERVLPDYYFTDVIDNSASMYMLEANAQTIFNERIRK